MPQFYSLFTYSTQRLGRMLATHNSIQPSHLQTLKTTPRPHPVSFHKKFLGQSLTSHSKFLCMWNLKARPKTSSICQTPTPESVLTNSSFHTHAHTHTYIYTYMCINTSPKFPYLLELKPNCPAFDEALFKFPTAND